MSNVTGTTATVTGLANGTKYYFTVASVNPAGNSAPSNEANATTTTPSGGGGSLKLSDLLLAAVLVLGRLVAQRRRMMRRIAT
jgi:chitodextrinase